MDKIPQNQSRPFDLVDRSKTYYVAKREWLYLLRQTRFMDHLQGHPHDVCAVANSLEQLQSMFKGNSKDLNSMSANTDWDHVCPDPFPNQKL